MEVVTIQNVRWKVLLQIQKGWMKVLLWNQNPFQVDLELFVLIVHLLTFVRNKNKYHSLENLSQSWNKFLYTFNKFYVENWKIRAFLDGLFFLFPFIWISLLRKLHRIAVLHCRCFGWEKKVMVWLIGKFIISNQMDMIRKMLDFLGKVVDSPLQSWINLMLVIVILSLDFFLFIQWDIEKYARER